MSTALLSILPIGYNYLILDEKFTSVSDFECSLRIRKLKTVEDAKKWINELSLSSLVTWKVARTYPNSGKVNLYKGEFRCQHNVSGKHKAMKKSKHTNCPARLSICIKRYLKGTHAKNPDPLSKLWPCKIIIKNTHNHSLSSADVLQYRPVLDSTRSQLLSLFSRGHSPSTVLDALKLQLLITEPQNYSTKSLDTSYIPLVSYCYREYGRSSGRSYRERDKRPLETELESLLGGYINGGGGGRATLTTLQEHIVIAIFTPLMQRVHSLIPQSSKVVHFHSYGERDKKGRIFLFSTETKLGFLPLGCILSDTDSQAVFQAGLQLFKSILPTEGFFKSISPDIIVMSEEETRWKIPLLEEFPNSLILTSKSHYFKLFWDFIWEEKNGVPKSFKQDLYIKFKKILNSASDGELMANFEKITNPPHGEEFYETVNSFMNILWTVSGGFSTIYRDGLLVGGIQKIASDDVIILSKILNESIISRTKGLNLVQLSEFVITTFEKYWMNRLTNSTFYTENLLKIFIPPAQEAINVRKVKKLYNGVYEVPSPDLLDPSVTIETGTEIGQCSHCSPSFICPHLSAVYHAFYSDSISSRWEERDIYYEIATGDPLANNKNNEKNNSESLCSSETSGRRYKNITNLATHQEIEKSNNSEEVGKVVEIEQDIHAPNYEATPQEIEEGERILSQISSWFSSVFAQNPKYFLPALKCMHENILTQTLTEEAAREALSSFGLKNCKNYELNTFLPKEVPEELFRKNVYEEDGNYCKNVEIIEEEEVLEEDEEIVEEESNEETMTYLPIEQICKDEEELGESYIILITEGSNETSIPIKLSAATVEQLKGKEIIYTTQDGTSLTAIYNEPPQETINL